MDEISKTRMEVAIKCLERRAATIEDIPAFRGILATAFDKEHLVMLCKLFAEEWHKTQQLYCDVLKGEIPTYIERARKTLYKPSLWRKIWNRIKSWASCTPDSAHGRTKTNAKA